MDRQCQQTHSRRKPRAYLHAAAEKRHVAAKPRHDHSGRDLRSSPWEVSPWKIPPRDSSRVDHQEIDEVLLGPDDRRAKHSLGHDQAPGT